MILNINLNLHAPLRIENINIGVFRMIIIRKATSQETKQILNYAPIVMKESTMGFLNESKEIAVQIMSKIITDGGYYLVYIDNKVVKGWIGVGWSYNLYTNEMEVMIAELYVLPQYRKKGIARKLIDHVIRRLRKAGYQKVQLNVFAENYAKYLYEKLGFYDVSTLMEKNLFDDPSD